MVGTVLLVVSEGFDDMAYLANQVILEEAGNDVITTSYEAGAIKGETSSAMTVALEEALNQDREYIAIVIVGGNDLGKIANLSTVVSDFYSQGKYVGGLGQGVDIIKQAGIGVEISSGSDLVQSERCLTMLEPEDPEAFAEKLAELI